MARQAGAHLVPFPPGGGTDIQAPALSSAFQKSMGQNFIMDNRTGAAGLIATQLAVESPPDGNTILFTSGSLSVIVTLYAKRMKFNVLHRPRAGELDLLDAAGAVAAPECAGEVGEGARGAGEAHARRHERRAAMPPAAPPTSPPKC